MFKQYGKAFRFFVENKVILFLIFFAALLNSPLRSNMFTGPASVFLSIFFIGGFLGLVHRIEKGQMEARPGIKSFIVEAGSNFSYIILNLLEIVIIVVLNLIVVIFFTVLPIIVLNPKVSLGYSNTIIVMIIIMIGAFRMPFLLFSYFTVIVNKSYGKIGIAKLKEVVWETPSAWVSVYIQGIIYMVLTYFWLKNSSDILVFHLIDILRSVLFMFFMVVNYYIYTDKISKNEKLKEIFETKKYEGRYKGIMGRFVM